MPTTTLDYLTSAQDGFGFDPWIDINNMLGASGFADCIVNTAGSSGNDAILTGPLSGSEVPSSGVVITNILIRINCSRQSGSEFWPADVQIGSGSQKTITGDIGTSLVNVDYSGDLDYWGITNDEAFDFINSVDSMRFNAFMNAGANDLMSVAFVQVQFTYEDAPVVALPTIF